MKKEAIVTFRNRNQKVEEFIANYGTLFHSFEYLSSVGENYICYVVLGNNEDELLAVLPLVKSFKYKVSSYNLPPLTYLYGPVVKDNNLVSRGETITNLLKEINRSSRIDFKYFASDYEIELYKNHGFEVNEMTTFVFQNNKKYDFSSLSKSKKRDVKKLNKLLEEGKIKLVENLDVLDEVLILWEKTAEHSNFSSKIKYLRKIIDSGIDIYVNIIVSADGTVLSGAICPYDKFKMYHLVSASNRNVYGRLKEANAMSLYTAIEKANNLGLDFDFEGSNIEGVAKFYRSMGGKKRINYSFVKTNSIYYKIIDFITSV